VTHDIDEAIKMGDRIAILREGGVLAQYDTPTAILSHPADDFVASFVGADRALKRLSLISVGELDLDPADDARGFAEIPTTQSVRDALAQLLSAGGRPLTVIDERGAVRGLVTLQAIERLLVSEAGATHESVA
jgi:osmoprotectant transport system ATP-binding protein